MAKRKRMRKRRDKKVFRNTASKVRVENLRAQPMRGGFRLAGARNK